MTELIIKLKKEVNNIENNEIQLKNENKQLRKEIDDMKDKENQLIDKNTQIFIKK